MSHLKERKEKICLNCNAAIYGRYCHVCGQENIEPKESFWHLLTHFVFDLFHFDGKFFVTLKYLLFRPGYLSIEHLNGRRASYLHPIRLYIFVSAFFFLILFSFYSKSDHPSKSEYATTLEQLEKKQKNIEKLYIDSTDKQSVLIADSFLNILKTDIALLKKDTSQYKNLKSMKLNYGLLLKNIYYQTENEGIDIQPSENIVSYLDEKRKKYNSTEEFNEKLIEGLVHAIPKGLIVALPFYALFLLVIYYRNKQYNYVSHLVFTIYLFSFTFVLILMGMWLNSLFNWLHINATGVINAMSIFIAILYTYKALRSFYQQSRIKTIAKFLILTCFCVLLAISVALIAFSLSFFTI